MKNGEFKKQLEKELRTVGASRDETSELLSVVDKLFTLRKIERSYDTQRKFFEKQTVGYAKHPLFFKKWALAIAFSIILLFGGFISTALAQKSLPGDFLYPVKRLSENAVSFVNPDFQKEKLKRRQAEIGQLKEEKRGDKLIKKAQEDYEHELRKNEERSTSSGKGKEREGKKGENGSLKKSIKTTDKRKSENKGKREETEDKIKGVKTEEKEREEEKSASESQNLASPIPTILISPNKDFIREGGSEDGGNNKGSGEEDD